MMKLELDLDYSLLEDKTIFYEWQNAIKEDFKRVLMFIKDYENTNEKDRLINFLNYINETISKNKPLNHNDVTLKIILNYEYLVFTIYSDTCNDENDFYETILSYQDNPLIIIFKRDISKLCLIEEEMWIDPKKKGMDDTYYYGLYNFTYFLSIKKKRKLV